MADTAENMERRGYKYDKMSIVELATALSDLTADLAFRKSQNTEIQKDIDVLSMSVIPDMLEDLEIETMTITDIGRLQCRPDAWCSLPAGNREAFHQWCRDNGHEPLITNTISPKTLKAFIKERIKEGKEYPQDLVKYEPYQKAIIVKS